MKPLLAIDVGMSIVGILDLHTGEYTSFPGSRMAEGARRILECDGIVITFNGPLYDLPILAKLVGFADARALPWCGEHFDMREEAVRDRWPPDEGGKPIMGPSLREHYRHYFDTEPPAPPRGLDEYEQDNWCDCYMAGALWKRLVRNVDGAA